jgi:lipase maturation factor 1
LILPFLIFSPRRLRFFAAFGILLLQSCIFLTGNYNWFNLQTMLLCLLLFDDAALRKILPSRLIESLRPRRRVVAEPRAATVVVSALALLMVACSLVQMDERFGGDPPEEAVAIDDLIEPFHIVNPYGLFALMTTSRDEIITEGSDDGVEWREYEFRYKPGDLARRPPWNIPHQPRLDWQMWFAALDDPQRLPWFSRFLERLLENEPTVTALLETNPFPDKPPIYVRAQFYDYTYAGSEKKASSLWWDRQLVGLYFPAVHLKPQ